MTRKIPLDGNPHRQQLRNELEIIPRMNIPTGRNLTKVSQTMWLKNERGKNNAPVAPTGTTPAENVENRSSWQLSSLIRIGETVNLIESHGLQCWQSTTLHCRVQSKSLRLTEYIEKCLPKSRNYAIQKSHRGTGRKLFEVFPFLSL